VIRNTPPDSSGRPDRAYLIHASDKQSYSIAKTVFRIGRDASSHLQVLDSEISREQAEVKFQDGGHVIDPVGKGLTKVNGIPITSPVRLNEGDLIGIGEVTLVYTRRSPSGAIVTEAGWADDIRVAEASTETERKFHALPSRTMGSRAGLYVITGTVLILLVWALVFMR
jgi:pSer/pThr/pTyr-binding forkhead associated (FHA) protein